MTNNLLIILFILNFTTAFSQAVGIGTANPHESSKLEIDALDRGLLIPRLTTAQRNNIQSPANGLQIYNTTDQCLQIYTSVGWKCVSFSSSCIISGLGLVIPPIGENSPVRMSINQPNTNYRYSWTFQSATPASSTDENPIVEWDNPGTYNIQVLVEDSYGCSALLSTPVTVNPCLSYPDSTFTHNGSVAGLSVSFFANEPSPLASFRWIFEMGNPASSTLKNPVNIWNTADVYNVSLIVANPNGCGARSTQQLQLDSCKPQNIQTFNFNSCGATGPEGPNQAQCDAAYGAGVVTVAGGIQQWIVPESGRYSISMAGAAGAGSTAPNTGQGGAGGSASGELFLSQGTILYISVGQKGIQQSVSSTSGGFNGGGNGGNSNCTTCYGYGGGGGTDVRLGGSGLGNRILVAGGGGGAGGSNGTSASRGMAGGGGGGGYYGGGGAGSWTGNLPQSGVFGIGGNGVNANLSSSTAIATSGNGGNGGGNTGTDGIDGSANIGSRGRAGTQSAGGAAGGCITGAISGVGPGGGGGGSGYFNPSVVTNGSTSTGTNTGNGWVVIQRLCP